MYEIIHLTLLTICYLQWAHVEGADCAYKKCVCSDGTIFCAKKKFTSVPNIISTRYSQYSSLLFDNNQITVIASGSMLPNQTDISFLDNPITTIDDTAFDGSSNTLQLLQFSNARFTTIPNAFSHLNNLTYLSIANTNILDWNEDAMKHIGLSLNTLYLSNVSLTTWPSWINFFTRVSQLSVISNAFTSLPDDGLDALATSLTTLYLHSNRLISAPKALSKLTSLKLLYLQDNEIFDLTYLSQYSTLQSLSLNNNDIFDANQLSNSLRPFADTLYETELQYNQLTEIPRLDFLTQVLNIDLTHNKISNIIEGSMPPGLYDLDLGFNLLARIPRIMSSLKSVTDLHIPSNVITDITGAEFPPSTIVVELQHNLITDITDTSFPQNSTIKYLHLNNNPIVTISGIALSNLPLLVELYLVHTKVARLPLGLSSLTNLNILDFSGANDLVCTCAESSLQSWILKLTSENVKGNCGQSSIYYFFDILSPSCSQ